MRTYDLYTMYYHTPNSCEHHLTEDFVIETTDASPDDHLVAICNAVCRLTNELGIDKVIDLDLWSVNITLELDSDTHNYDVASSETGELLGVLSCDRLTSTDVATLVSLIVDCSGMLPSPDAFDWLDKLFPQFHIKFISAQDNEWIYV